MVYGQTGYRYREKSKENDCVQLSGREGAKIPLGKENNEKCFKEPET